MVESAPWLILHLLGTQYFQRYNAKMVTIFHVLLPLLYLFRALESFKPVVLLLAQPCAMFLATELLRKPIFVWLSAILIIIFNDLEPISSFKNWSFQDSSWHTKYVTHVTMFWINSRCVSFCLDHLWQEVPQESSKSWKFLQMCAFCFYLPISVQGPLINYKDYYEGTKNAFVFHPFYVTFFKEGFFSIFQNVL